MKRAPSSKLRWPSARQVRRQVRPRTGPDDPIFFDLDEDKLREDTADAMRAAGISPALIYAYEETGLIVTQENRRLIPDVELREFDAKVREYHDLGLGEAPRLH
jgi:hypothetical protein